MNQCARTFALIGLVVIIMLGLHYLPPLTIGGKDMRPVNMLSDLFPDTVQQHQPELPVVPLPTVAETQNETVDSVATDSVVVQPRLEDLYPDSIAPILDYAAGEAGSMNHFFSQLAAVNRMSRPVRIAYFGDSFIEGDILTGDLRELFQNDFGGSGVGWVDCGSIVNGFRQTIRHQFDGLEMHDAMNKPYKSELAGIAQRYFIPTGTATITMAGTRYKKHLDSWDQSSFFLKTPDRLQVTVTINGDTTVVDSLGASDDVQVLVHCGDSVRLHKMSYRLSCATGRPLLYGIAHESRRGVIIDNFSLRGSSGVHIAAVPMQTLRQFAQLRDYDLIIVHFGLNMIDDHNEQGVYTSYKQNMGRSVAHLRAAYPKSSILVISVSDRAQRTADQLSTMKSVETMTAYQQLMAAEQHVAFYNLFKAMGGEGSMAEMVEKGMANKDYTHINSAGGRHVAKIIYKSLMAAFDIYKEQAMPNQDEPTQSYGDF